MATGGGRKTGICDFFAKNGRCGYGDNCRFLHEAGGGDDVVGVGKKKEGKFSDMMRRRTLRRSERSDDEEEDVARMDGGPGSLGAALPLGGLGEDNTGGEGGSWR